MSDEDRTYRKNHYPLRLGLGPLEQLLANGVELIPSGYREDHPPDCTFTLFLLNQAPGLTYFISPTSGRLEVQYSPRGAKLQKREYGPGQHAFRFDDDSSFVVSETPDESAHLHSPTRVGFGKYLERVQEVHESGEVKPSVLDYNKRELGAFARFHILNSASDGFSSTFESKLLGFRLTDGMDPAKATLTDAALDRLVDAIDGSETLRRAYDAFSSAQVVFRRYCEEV